MTDMPAAMPLTMPVTVTTVAIVVPVLLHVPPMLVSVRLVVDPAHTVAVPSIAAGSGFTVTGVVTLQPAPSE